MPARTKDARRTVAERLAALDWEALLRHQEWNMKKLFLTALSLIVLALVLMALDDITTGHEPNFTLEYLMVTAGAAWFLALAALGLRRFRRRASFR